MQIRIGLNPLRKCAISLTLSMQPLSWTGKIMKSLSYIGSFTMSGSGIQTMLISPLLDVDAAMGIGGSSASKDLFIGSWFCR